MWAALWSSFLWHQLISWHRATRSDNIYQRVEGAWLCVELSLGECYGAPGYYKH